MREEGVDFESDVILVHGEREHVLPDVRQPQDSIELEGDVRLGSGLEPQAFLQQNVDQSSHKHGPIVAWKFWDTKT